MGAEQFETYARGASPDEAFLTARDEALYEYGHRGYTGTIAEKDSFVLIQSRPVENAEAAGDLAERLLRNDDERVADKWGPAGAIEYLDPAAEGRSFLFFGWASA